MLWVINILNYIKKLVMKTSNIHYNNFDILRLSLAILVFFAHWNILTQQNIFNQLFHLSGYAVDMFFIVSGFLIFWSFENDQNKSNFFIKRFFRVFPLYLLLILLQTLFFIFYSDGTSTQIFKYFISNFFFLNFLSPSVGDIFLGLEINAINGSLWTLKNELMFYLLVPFIFIYYKKWGGAFLMILYGLSVLYMYGVDYFGITKLLHQFPAQLRLFIVGIILYILFKKINNKNIYFLAIVGFISIFFLENNINFEFIFYPFSIGILMIFLVYYINIINIKFDFSYSFYILHFPVIQLALYFHVNPSNPIISFISLFFIILLLSYFSEKYIEKKFIQIGKSMIKREVK